MKKIYLLSALAVSLLVLSCSSSKDVISGRFIQKRKYMPGYFVQNLISNNKGNTRSDAENIGMTDDKPVNNPSTQDKEENIYKIMLISSATDNPTIYASGDNAAADIRQFYQSDISEIKTFKKEYKQIKKETASRIIKKAAASSFIKHIIKPTKGGGGGFSILSFILAIIGIFFAGIICGILAFILGLIGVLRGRFVVLAVIGMLIGVLDVIGALIAISLM